MNQFPVCVGLWLGCHLASFRWSDGSLFWGLQRFISLFSWWWWRSVGFIKPGPSVCTVEVHSWLWSSWNQNLSEVLVDCPPRVGGEFKHLGSRSWLREKVGRCSSWSSWCVAEVKGKALNFLVILSSYPHLCSWAFGHDLMDKIQAEMSFLHRAD